MPPKPVSSKEIESYAISALKRWLKKTMSFPEVRKRLILLEAKTYQVDISVVSDQRMAKINHAFRKVKKPTDILSFPTHEFFQRQGVLGDLVICGPVAVFQANSMGHSWKKEIDVLIVHGILHLLHFDHETSAKDSQNMSDWESKILGREYASTLISRNEEDESVPAKKAVSAKSRASPTTVKKTKAKATAKAKSSAKITTKTKAKTKPKTKTKKNKSASASSKRSN